MMYGWHQHAWGPGMWIVMILGMIVFWSVVVGGVVLLVRHFGGHRNAAAPVRSSAEDALRERYARGEIDEEEFVKRLAVLKTHG